MDVVVGVRHPAAAAASVGRIDAVDHVLIGERDERARLLEPLALEGAESREGPACAARALRLHRRHVAGRGPVERVVGLCGRRRRGRGGRGGRGGGFLCCCGRLLGGGGGGGGATSDVLEWLEAAHVRKDVRRLVAELVEADGERVVGAQALTNALDLLLVVEEVGVGLVLAGLGAQASGGRVALLEVVLKLLPVGVLHVLAASHRRWPGLSRSWPHKRTHTKQNKCRQVHFLVVVFCCCLLSVGWLSNE